jgi:hypothetical protein
MPVFLRAHFPLILPAKVPPGACMNGTATLGRFARDQGCKVKYCFNPGAGVDQGHMWILAQKKPPGWMAIDPCTDRIEDWHYEPRIVADRFDDIQKIIPQRQV